MEQVSLLNDVGCPEVRVCRTEEKKVYACSALRVGPRSAPGPGGGRPRTEARRASSQVCRCRLSSGPSTVQAPLPFTHQPAPSLGLGPRPLLNPVLHLSLHAFLVCLRRCVLDFRRCLIGPGPWLRVQSHPDGTWEAQSFVGEWEREHRGRLGH